MNRLSIPLKATFTLLVIALLVACAPGEEPPSPEEIQGAINTAVAMTMEAEGQIATSVAMTVAAREVESVAALPTATQVPTLPLPTLTPILPTATPFAVAPSSNGGGGGGGGSSSTADYACSIIRRRPADNTEFNPNGTFDITFTILNTGAKKWDAGKDLVHSFGPDLIVAPAFTALQLPEVKPGETYTVGPYDAKAPDKAGHYVMEFKLEGGWCWPYIAINVK